MSAATSQPLVGQSKSAAPFGAVALIAGVLTFGAIGIALGQGAKATPAVAVPADVQAALIAQRMGEKASLFPAVDPRLIQHQAELADRLGAYGASDPRLIQHMGELQDRIAAPVVYGTIVSPDGLVFGRPIPVAPTSRTLSDGRIVDLHSSIVAGPAASGTYVTSDGRVIGRPRAIPVKPSVHVLPNGRIVPLHPSTNLGPKTAAQKGLVEAGTSRYSGKTRDALTGSVAANRWTVLATNPYSQRLLSRTVAPAAFATGGMRFIHR